MWAGPEDSGPAWNHRRVRQMGLWSTPRDSCSCSWRESLNKTARKNKGSYTAAHICFSELAKWAENAGSSFTLARRVGFKGLGGSGKRGQMAGALQQPKTVLTAMWESLRGLPDIGWTSWIQDVLFCGLNQVKSVPLPLFVIWLLNATISFELVVEGGAWEQWPELVSEGESVHGLSWWAVPKLHSLRGKSKDLV